MLRKFLGILLVICLTATTPVMVAAAEVPIQLYVNNEKVDGVNLITKSGLIYVPFRSFFDKLGYKVAVDANSGGISGFLQGSELKFWPGEDVLEYDGGTYYLENPIPVIKGQAYLPLRLVGDLAKFSVNYDKAKRTVRLMPYGYGEDAPIKELIAKYCDTFSPTLLSSDNLTLGYYNPEYDYDANQSISEIPVREIKVTIDRIEYISAIEANLKISYIKKTEVLEREDEYEFKIRKEKGKWKIVRSGWLSNKMGLPKDIDALAAIIVEKNQKEQNAVLSDLRTYYRGLNEEDVNLTVQYTSPTFIKQWNEEVIGPEVWESSLSSSFNYSDFRYKLSEERVLFLGDKEAVVQGTLDWRDASKEELHDVFSALIYMEYANGHWTFSSDISLDQGFNKNSVESAEK